MDAEKLHELLYDIQRQQTSEDVHDLIMKYANNETANLDKAHLDGIVVTNMNIDYDVNPVFDVLPPLL